ncbi:Ribosomal protein L35 [Macleaya cordata]|uniref:50S ribosomal protein L35 n=1 Tax=Macleaya cordata TaxID=56857 RepID=A0A200R6W9_MACCD|nr:Ribosomal protein L35 [Macleaya cordata]
MQRWFGKLRPFATSATENLSFLSSSSSHRTLLHSSPSPQLQQPVSLIVNNSIFKPLFNAPSITHPQMLHLGFQSSFTQLFLNQSRHFSSKERKRTRVTPVTSKLKKTKMKSYSSFKSRFRVMNDGQIRRWRAGKRHNAHLKSKISKRRLRLPALVHPAYAKVMKKLNFTAC